MTGLREIKRLDFVASSREDLREFPEEVREDIGYALFEVQRGGKPMSAKPLKGFGIVSRKSPSTGLRRRNQIWI